MALRLIEVTIPAEGEERIPELLDDVSVIDCWTVASGDERAHIRVLVEADDTEALSDALVEAFGSSDVFRLVALSAETTLPRPEEEEEEEEGADEEEENASAGRVSREELLAALTDASRLTIVYVVMIALSTIVAAVGIVRDDVAIVIGAMVIAPLLGPNLALALAATLGDLELAGQSLRVIAAGLATALALSLAAGFLLGVEPTANPQIAGRTTAGLGDVALALAAGAAGSLAFTTGVPAVAVGVMVAVALLPPLVVAGMLAGAGHGAAAFGATMLVVTNVTCVNLAAVATFLAQKVGPRTWWEEERARKATRIAVATWLGMLAVLVALILLGYLG